MSRGRRGNPLALAVLLCLGERPMHPYEIATTLRQRHQHESVRLNYGSLYAVVAALEARGHVRAEATQREGRLPERTIYTLTDSGTVEAQDWLTELLATPANEFPTFEAALSFLPALPPARVAALLTERAGRLELAIAQARAARDLAVQQGIPLLHRVQDEYRTARNEAALGFVRHLCAAIDAGTLDGIEWWDGIHAVVPAD